MSQLRSCQKLGHAPFCERAIEFGWDAPHFASVPTATQSHRCPCPSFARKEDSCKLSVSDIARDKAYVLDMDVVLSHESALAAMRLPSAWRCVESATWATDVVPASLPRAQHLRELVEQDPVLQRLSTPLDLLVSGGRARTRSSLAHAHLESAELPPGSLLRLTGNVLCVSPEHLSVQMASQLTHLELVFLLSELMGLYAIDPSAEEGMVQRERPLMTPESLRAHLDALGPRRGTRVLARALADACVESGSPRETKLSMRLALKPALGGNNLNVLSMNEPLEVRRICDRMKKGVRKPDILVSSRSESRGGGERRFVAVEYHGRYHDNPEQLARDAARTNELKAIGIGEYVIRREQYRQDGYVDGIADAIKRELGQPPRRLTRAERARRRTRSRQLYEELERIDGVHWNGRERERAVREQGSADGWYEEVPLEAYGL